MKNILLSLAVVFGMQAGAQTIDTIIADTLLNIHYSSGTIDTASISRIDSLTFTYINDTVWGGACNGLTSLTYNGYDYDLVEIGNQCWFKENLQTTSYKDGTSIQDGADSTIWNNDTTGAYAWFDNDSISYASIWGALYNWYAVNNSAGLCPVGWHVPSDSAWTILESYLETNGYNYDGSTSGNKYAKAMADSVGWLAYAGVGTVGNTDYPLYRNKSGFTGRPGGYRYFPAFSSHLISKHGRWWSSSEETTLNAWYRNLNCCTNSLGRTNNNKGRGFSVRCIKD